MGCLVQSQWERMCLVLLQLDLSRWDGTGWEGFPFSKERGTCGEEFVRVEPGGEEGGCDQDVK